MYYIIEFANTHGGDVAYLDKLVDDFADLTGNFGMKFQPFKYDQISLKDFEWRNVYKALYFNEKTWAQIIAKAVKTKDVWIDLFDLYGVSIIRKNHELIYGIKFQSSVLRNLELIGSLAELDLTEKRLIINIAAQPIKEVKKIIGEINKRLNPKEILIEFGFQAYPTILEHSGLNKLKKIRKHFKNRVVFADHVDGQSEDAVWLPAVAAVAGVDMIEKHVMLSDVETKYDQYSSITKKQFLNMVENVERYSRMVAQPFIVNAEEQYLENSIMQSVTKKRLSKGKPIDIKNDLIYRRTNQKGLGLDEIFQLQSNYHLLSKSIEKSSVLKSSDFKKATIATIIACRMKSSRLKRKALLKIGNYTSIERCIKSTLAFKDVNHTILATSSIKEDQILSQHLLSEEVIFHAGDPDDVIDRYLEVCDRLKVDIIVRVTGDMPFVSAEICQILLNSHFENGADYTAARKTAVGTAPEIITVSALRKIKDHFGRALHSEYMSWYLFNNPMEFNINYVELPPELIRDYRLTIDYQADLDLLDKIEAENATSNLTTIFHYLDENPDVARINQDIQLIYKTDTELIEKLNRETKMT